MILTTLRYLSVCVCNQGAFADNRADTVDRLDQFVP